MLTRLPSRTVIVVLALIVAAATFLVLRSSGEERWKVAAEFTDTTGLYVGNEVQYLGVPVGEITAITPEGPVMRVEMSVDSDIKVPEAAVAQVLQSALLTDRYVELGPVYKGGPTLAAGTTIPATRTRSPISFDQLGAAIDGLVVALDREGPDGRDIGDLLAVTADNLDGNGARIRKLLVSSQAALASVNRMEPDLTVVAKNLRILAKTLSGRDAVVRRFATNLSEASEVLAGQTQSLDQTLRSLSALSTEVSSFVEENRDLLTANLRDVSKITTTIRGQQDALARIFDYMPTGAENIARAYDPVARSIRVQMAIREAGPFNSVALQTFCAAVAPGLCPLFTNPDGTGLGDLLFGLVENQIPGGF